MSTFLASLLCGSLVAVFLQTSIVSAVNCSSSTAWNLRLTPIYFPNNRKVGNMQGGMYQNKTYMIYGEVDNQDIYGIYVYDHLSDSFSNLTTSKYPASEMVTYDQTYAVFDNLVYFWASGPNQFMTYDMVSNNFTNKGSGNTLDSSCWVTIGTLIYVIGGRNGKTTTTSYAAELKTYDTATNIWTTLSPMPFTRQKHLCAAYGTDIYIFGGFDGAGWAQNNIWKYETAATPLPKYTQLSATFPFQTFGYGATVIYNGAIILISGSRLEPYIFDPITETLWANKYSLENDGKISGSLVVAYNEEIVIFGNKQYTVGSIECDDSTEPPTSMPTRSVSTTSSPTAPIITAANCSSQTAWNLKLTPNYFPNNKKIGNQQGGLYNGKSYMIYGEADNEPIYGIYVYDFASNSFSNLTTSSYTASEMATFDQTYAVFDNLVYFWASAPNRFMIYNMADNTFTDKGFDNTLDSSCWVTIGTLIYVIGGRNGKGTDRYADQLKTYDTATDTWTTLSSLPFTRQKHLCAAYGTDIYIFGGFDGAGFAQNSTWKYETAATPLPKYTQLAATIPYQTFGYGATVIYNDAIILVSGSRLELLIFDPMSETLRENKFALENDGKMSGPVVVLYNGEVVIFSNRQYTFGSLECDNSTAAPTDSSTASPTISTTIGNSPTIASPTSGSTIVSATGNVPTSEPTQVPVGANVGNGQRYGAFGALFVGILSVFLC